MGCTTPLLRARPAASPGWRGKPLTVTDQTLLHDLDRLIDPWTRGDPQSPLRWTCKSTYRLAEALQQQGHRVSQRTVHRLLVDQALLTAGQPQGRRRGRPSGPRCPVPVHLQQVKQFQRRGQPVISVDTKKKENIGNYANRGQEWEKQGEPRRTKTHDFRSKGEDKACPYGVYDPTWNEGWVNVGISHDTAQFAVASIRGWWQKLGQDRYPQAEEVLITADAGGSNGYRTRLWKVELQKLADELRLMIAVSHFPPGTSKWNTIEHRLFSFISKNWRGRPLDSLAADCEPDRQHDDRDRSVGGSLPGLYDLRTRDQSTDEEMEQLNLKREAFHGEWNYTISHGELKKSSMLFWLNAVSNYYY